MLNLNSTAKIIITLTYIYLTFIPKLFSDDQPQEDLEQREEKESHTSERLFDQDTSEDEDFEIPAFLRRQKF